MIPEKPFKKNGEDSDLDITIDLGEPATGITKNQALDLTIYYNLQGGEAVKGNYKVKIFCDGSIIGSDGFSLK